MRGADFKEQHEFTLLTKGMYTERKNSMKYFINKTKKEAIKLNLQFFAEGGSDGGNGEGNSDGGNGENGGLDDKNTYTKEEVLKLIQAESDRRVQQAIEKLNKKHNRQLEQQRTLSALDDDERKAAEKDIRIRELEEELEKSQLSNTKAEIAKVLSNRGMSAELVDFVVTSTDEEECLEKIKTLENIFKEMVKKEVGERMKGYGGGQMSSNGSLSGSITKEQFAKMSLSERNDIFMKNRELYNELTK